MEQYREQCLSRDARFQKVLKLIKAAYVLTGLAIGLHGLRHRSAYEVIVGLATWLLLPGIWLVRRLFHLVGGWAMETYVYLFSFLGWSLGGAAGVYGLLPGFDKLVHFLSGIFVSMLVLAGYRFLERDRGEEKTARWFVFLGSMGVAALFELCEFALAPIMHRDLQHVLDTGVGDTMMDIFVCLLGTLVFLGLQYRASRGHHDPFTDAAEAFVLANAGNEK